MITGASAGIGQELARQFAPRAKTLVLVARRVDRLETLRDELQTRYRSLTVHLAPCDLSNPAAINAMLTKVLQQVGHIDVLVNNAGVGYQARYADADWERVHQVIQVNVVALALLTQRLLGPMVERGRGGILNINSGAGLALVPGAAAYVGSKHFVTGFTDTLYAEVADSGVVITQVCPGPVATEFDAAAGISGLSGGPPAFVKISAAQCAREAIAGFERGRAMIFPGFMYRLSMRLLPLVPRRVQRLVARRAARQLPNAMS